MARKVNCVGRTSLHDETNFFKSEISVSFIGNAVFSRYDNCLIPWPYNWGKIRICLTPMLTKYIWRLL
jgi:hypothetical protein